jgi:hypothetical protein
VRTAIFTFPSSSTSKGGTLLEQDYVTDIAGIDGYFAFDVQGFVHLGNVYVRLKFQLDAHVFICTLYFARFALHVSGAVCTHHQEHKLQSTAIGMRNGYGM